MTARQTSFEAAILSRIIRPDDASLTREAAQGFLSLAFPPEDLRRMRELASKARQGDLSEEERQQADAYERLGSLLGLLQSKARRALNATAAHD